MRMDLVLFIGKLKFILILALPALLFSCFTKNNEQKPKEYLDSIHVNRPVLKKDRASKRQFKKLTIPTLTGKTISCHLGDNCTSYYEFKSESEFEFWSCELQELNKGSFIIADSLLILNEKRIAGNIQLREEFIRLTMIYSGVFFVLDKRELLKDGNWITTYERSRRNNSIYAKECKYTFQ